MKTSDVLYTAADLIEGRGWGQGPDTWGDNDGSPVCLEGGIIAALGFQGWNDIPNAKTLWNCPAYKAVADYLGCDITLEIGLFNEESPRQALWKWNDDADRTAEQVIATLRATAVIEAAKENAAVEVSA